MAEMGPSFMQGVCRSPQLDRLVLSNLICQEGVSYVGGGDLLVTTTGTTNHSVSVAEGGAFIQGDDVNDQGMYSAYNDAPTVVGPLSAGGANPRIDQIIARIYDAQYGAVTSEFKLEILEGTPTAGANLTPGSGTYHAGAEALPANAIRLAWVLVPTTDTTSTNISASNIEDGRTPAGSCGAGGFIERAAGPSSQTDYTAEASVVTLQAELKASRRYRITGAVKGNKITNTGFVYALMQIDGASFTPYEPYVPPFSNTISMAANLFGAGQGSHDFTTTDGIHDFTLRVAATTAAFRIPADGAYLMLEDIGPV